MIIDPQKSSLKDIYKLMSASIVPRPIAFVSTISKSGVPNLAPFSYFTGLTSQPPTLCISIARKGPQALKKDTLVNIEETGGFVVNTVSEFFVEKMAVTGQDFPADVNEFSEAGLTEEKSTIVQAPRVKESLISLECKLHQIVQIGPAQPGAGFLVIGEIVLFHIADEIFLDGKIDVQKLNPVGRLAGYDYMSVGRVYTVGWAKK